MWEKIISSEEHDTQMGNDLVADSEGNLYITGYIESKIFGIPETKQKHSTSNLFVLKYDTNGNMLWIKIIGKFNDNNFDDFGSEGIYIDITGENDCWIAGIGRKGVFQQEDSDYAYYFLMNIKNTNGRRWYLDEDNDGYAGKSHTSILNSIEIEGYKSSSDLIQSYGDCNVMDSNINPSANEICDNQIDENCDGELHPDECSTPTCRDFDQDGYYAQSGCGTSRDCNDNDSSIYPGAIEIRDNKDNDCNDQIDDDCTGDTGNIYGVVAYMIL